MAPMKLPTKAIAQFWRSARVFTFPAFAQAMTIRLLPVNSSPPPDDNQDEPQRRRQVPAITRTMP